jgi:hypothetical protein
MVVIGEGRQPLCGAVKGVVVRITRVQGKHWLCGGVCGHKEQA